MLLYSYFRSSAAYRVRIALALKGLPYQTLPVHLVRQEQRSPAYTARAPSQLVPLLVDGADGTTDKALYLSQSLAICEYLEETHPHPPLLPADAAGRARVRSLALDIACEIHPLNNLRVLRYLGETLQLSEAQKTGWYRHWVALGLGALEQRLANDPATGRCCHGDRPGLADLCLVPQVFNARRFDCPLEALPTVCRIVEHCEQLPAFQAAHPSACPDAA